MRTSLIVGVLGGLSLLCGVCSGTTSRVRAVSLDPKAIGQRAVQSYDTNADQKLSAEEMARWPAGRAFVARFDQNSDNFVTANEIEARLKKWQDSKVGLMTVQCSVLLDGAPLYGAQLRLVPDACMGEGTEPAAGETDARGSASPAIADTKLPGVRPGFYRVEITHPQVNLPVRFNSSSELGLQAAPDAPESTLTTFHLTSQ